MKIHLQEIFLSLLLLLIWTLCKANPHLSRAEQWEWGDVVPSCTKHLVLLCSSKHPARPQVLEGSPRQLPPSSSNASKLRRAPPAACVQSVFVLIRILNYNRAQSSEVPLHYC